MGKAQIARSQEQGLIPIGVSNRQGRNKARKSPGDMEPLTIWLETASTVTAG